MAQKKLYIKTYGCQMNVYDSMRMEDLMRPLGYENTEEPDNADMVILNTCHIREKAAEKVYSELGRIKKKQDRSESTNKKIIAIAGCVGQAEGEEIFRRAPYVDVIVGPQSYQSLPDLVGKVQRDSGHHINLEFEEDKFDKLPENNNSQGVSAVLSIQEGCDKFCTFCVVPYTRGAEYSRPVAKIYRDAIELVAKGAKEIWLLGQNVNAFHGEASDGKIWNLGQLIKHIAKIDGLERIRYSTPHPVDMHEDLYDTHKNEPKLMPQLNLPVQSGSNEILRNMNRKYNRINYLKIIERLKQDKPDIQFSSDFIIGFPGETEEDFEDTMDLARQVGFSQAYSFKYSPRPGTPGADMTNQVPEDVQNERLQRFQALIKEQQLAYNKTCIGKTMKVLFEKKGKKDGQIIGKSPYMQSVHVIASEDLIGQIINVTITDARPNSLGGVIE